MPGTDPINDLLGSAPGSSPVRHGRSGRPGRRRPRAWLVVALSLALVVGGGAGAVWMLQRSLEAGLERIDDPFEALDEATRPSPAPVDPAVAAEPLNFLILGSDSRISAGDPRQWEAGAQRTDAIMLLHLSADRQSAQVISFPRDSWVAIPGHGEGKINAAFSYGGPTLMIQTVEQLTGVRIDHFAVTDFVSFQTLTDAVRGVEIAVPEATTTTGGDVLEAGVHTMTGEEALAYARERYGLPNGDFGRVQRQQNWMRAIMAKAADTRGDVGAMNNLVQAVARSVAVDETLTLWRMQEIAVGSMGLGVGDVTFLTAPHSGTGRSPDGAQSIVVLDRATLDPLMAAVADDSVAQYVQDHADQLVVLGDTVR
ncbi:LCP family protein [Antribacter gilvus]|uniref:LCP family protein n=1 Tax=Antribacter gilvus TaxID=2304675 RepID=UPI000F7A6DB9|nr:LCP family protein [Antribacter gilvus]